MPTLMIDEPTAAALRQLRGGVDLLDGDGTPLGRFLPTAHGTAETDDRQEWVARMTAEFPPDELDRIEAEAATRTMAEVLALAEEPT